MIPTLIKTLTADGDSTLSFVNGAASVVLDGTYDHYMFVFTDISPETDDADFQWNVSTDAGSNYNLTKTSTAFAGGHNEADNDAFVEYKGGSDLAQATTFQFISQDPMGSGTDATASGAGIFHLFNPASTTYVKHFLCRFNFMQVAPGSWDMYTAGYVNTTSDIDAIQFKHASGDFAGVIQMYGVA